MKGVYILIFFIRKNINVNIGALGKIDFKKGSYAYVGSARNGIRQRVERHLRKDKKKHWHIDYLLANPNVKIESVFYKETNKKSDECKTAGKLIKSAESFRRFGCSDCRCKSHLFKFTRFKNMAGFRELK